MHRSVILPTCILLLVLSAVPAQAMVRFDVMLSGISLSDSEIDNLVEMAGNVQAACAEILGVSYQFNQAVNLRIFGSQADFRNYGGQKLAALGPAVGFYHARPMEVVVWAQNSKERMVSTLLHECTHLFLHLGGPRIPIALDEGLAEFFENTSQDQRSIRVAPSPTWDAISKVALLQDSFPDMEIFLNLSRQEWQRLDAQKIPVRAISWSLAFWLMETSSRQKILASYLNSLGRAGNAQPDLLLAQAARMSTAELNKELTKWVPAAHSTITLPLSQDGKSRRGTVLRQ